MNNINIIIMIYLMLNLKKNQQTIKYTNYNRYTQNCEKLI